MQNPFDNEERKSFQEMVARFMESEIWPNVDEWDEQGSYPHEINEKVCQLGVFGFGIEEQYGGLGFDDQFMRKASSFEMGRSSAGGLFASIGSRSIMLKPLVELANEEIKSRSLPELLSGRKGGALGITEPGGGSDVARIKTTAQREGHEWVLNGQKMFITGGMQASFFVVGARTGGEGLGGISLFFVDADTPGFKRTPIDKKMGWWTSDTAVLYFDECKIPESNLMGEKDKGFELMNVWLEATRLTVAATSVSRAERAFDIALDWSANRKQFGKPIGAFQATGFKLADMSIGLRAADLMVDDAVKRAELGVMQDSDAAMVKVFCSEMLNKVADDTVQIYGGMGLMDDYPLERFWRDARVERIWDGTSEIQRHIISRDLLRPLGA